MAIKKLIIIWGFIGTLIIAVCLLGFTRPAGAETMTCKVSAYIINMELIPLGDVLGHTVGYNHRKGLVFFENGEVATYTYWGTLDLIKGRGPFKGYSIFTFADGSLIVKKMQGVIEPGPKGLPLSVNGTGEFMKGTGRFQGIKGDFKITGKVLTPFSKEKETRSDIYFDVSGSYTLSPK